MQTTITLGGHPLKANEAGLVSLTDLYQAACQQGLADGKLEPKKWAQAPHGKKSGSTGKVSVSGGPGHDFVEFVAENLKVNAAHVYKTQRGRHGGGTFAHWQIALAYAKYLSPALHMQVNEVYARVKAGDVTLAAEIADKAKPADAAWLARRVQSTVARNTLTSTLQAHGVSGKGFADCTNAIYSHVLGGKKSEVCAHAAQLAERIESLERELYRTQDEAEYWHRECQNMVEQLRDDGRDVGLTQSGALVVVQPPPGVDIDAAHSLQGGAA